MKRFLTLLFTAIISIIGINCYAQGEDDFKVILSLKDGSVINGYIRTSLMGGAMKVGISETPKGSYYLYETKDIESLVYPALKEGQKEVRYVPSRALKKVATLISKSKEYKAEVLLRPVYKGEKVTGYVLPCVASTTISATMTYYTNTYQYLYKIEGEEVAVPYWFADTGIVAGLKAALKLLFKDFPEIIEMVDNGQIDRKEFIEHPEMMMPILNDVLVNRK